MDKYALVIGIAVAIVSIGFIIAHSGRNSKRKRTEFNDQLQSFLTTFVYNG